MNTKHVLTVTPGPVTIDGKPHLVEAPREFDDASVTSWGARIVVAYVNGRTWRIPRGRAQELQLTIDDDGEVVVQDSRA